MAEFTAITTQEAFDAAISDRLKRDRESYEKKMKEAGWKAPADIEALTKAHADELKKLQDAAAETEKQLKEKDEEIAKSASYRTDLEKTRIALAAGLKIDYASRLRGENEDEWKADAELLAKDFAQAHVPPMGNPDPKQNNNNTNAPFLAMAKALKESRGR